MELIKITRRLECLKNDYGRVAKLIVSEHKEVSRLAHIQLRELKYEISRLEEKFKELSEKQ